MRHGAGTYGGSSWTISTRSGSMAKLLTLQKREWQTRLHSGSSCDLSCKTGTNWDRIVPVKKLEVNTWQIQG